jgi:hypothetical protein
MPNSRTVRSYGAVAAVEPAALRPPFLQFLAQFRVALREPLQLFPRCFAYSGFAGFHLLGLAPT